MNVYYTADSHHLHKAMAKTGKGWRPFHTVREHTEHQVECWNRRVRPGDHVWHLGDVGIGSTTEILEIMSRLNGIKHLITGNHDEVWPGHRDAYKHQRRWLEVFDTVHQYGRRRIAGVDVLMCHFPYLGSGDHTGDERYKEYRLNDTGLWLLHGHVHDAWKRKGRQINVGVDMWDWTPVHQDELAEVIASH